jgi:hypothetical protein
MRKIFPDIKGCNHVEMNHKSKDMSSDMSVE